MREVGGVVGLIVAAAYALMALASLVHRPLRMWGSFERLAVVGSHESLLVLIAAIALAAASVAYLLRISSVQFWGGLIATISLFASRRARQRAA